METGVVESEGIPVNFATRAWLPVIGDEDESHHATGHTVYSPLLLSVRTHQPKRRTASESERRRLPSTESAH